MNFPLFPLYQQLLNKVDITNTRRISPSERSEIISFIKEHNHQSEVIYSLIKAYSLDHGIQSDGLPYNMVFLKSGLKVDLNLLPPPLQHILLECIRINKIN